MMMTGVLVRFDDVARCHGQRHLNSVQMGPTVGRRFLASHTEMKGREYA